MSRIITLNKCDITYNDISYTFSFTYKRLLKKHKCNVTFIYVSSNIVINKVLP